MPTVLAVVWMKGWAMQASHMSHADIKINACKNKLPVKTSWDKIGLTWLPPHYHYNVLYVGLNYLTNKFGFQFWYKSSYLLQIISSPT
jgi:hypothetical protein